MANFDEKYNKERKEIDEALWRFGKNLEIKKKNLAFKEEKSI